MRLGLPEATAETVLLNRPSRNNVEVSLDIDSSPPALTYGVALRPHRATRGCVPGKDGDELSVMDDLEVLPTFDNDRTLRHELVDEFALV
jgi:hypothetical protein